MRCPACGAVDTRVIDSRVIKENTEIRRRRLCDSCANRFTTYERTVGTFPAIIKKDGRREDWNREKILRGLSKACEKCPISVNQIEQLVDEIERSVGGLTETEVTASVIGEHVMSGLRKLDEVAYVRFASVYRSFKDIDEFIDELSDLIKNRDGKIEEKPK